jgi:hypothetical protein
MCIFVFVYVFIDILVEIWELMHLQQLAKCHLNWNPMEI